VKPATINTLLALAVLALAVIPVGAAVFVLGFVFGDSPCVMCWQQRAGMTLVALIGLFILRYGARPKYVGLAVLVGAWGLYMGIRHSSLHVARDIGQGFSAEILGAHTYTWSVFIFWVCVVTVGVLLLASKEAGATEVPRTLGPLERAAALVLLVVLAGNILQAFASTGPPPFMGQSDPIRFSFNPRHWVWSLEEWSPSPVSLRGRWSVDKPDTAAVPPDPAGGPLAVLPALALRRQSSLALPLQGGPTDLSYDEATDRFLITTGQGLYLTDGTLSRVLRHTVIDTGFSVDLARFGGACFLDAETVMALSENKSYVILREDDRVDAGRNFRYFLESFDRFEEVTRSRFGTVRARMMYVMSLAFDPAADSLYTITVPNARTRKLVVSRFDRRDLTLSEEFLPQLAAGTRLAFRGEGRSLDEYYVTGATVQDGRLYAISCAYSTLLSIDPGRRAVAAAYALPGLDRPAGIAFRGDGLYVVGEGGAVWVYERPAGTE